MSPFLIFGMLVLGITTVSFVTREPWDRQAVTIAAPMGGWLASRSAEWWSRAALVPIAIMAVAGVVFIVVGLT